MQVECDKYLTLHKTKGIQNDIMSEAASLGSKQTPLNIPTLSTETKALLDLDFAEACYISGLPFTVYQDEAMQRGFRTLNPAYKPHNRKALAGPLLDKVYINVKEKVDLTIQSTKLLNIVTDESTNINNARIVNISFHIPSSAIHWRSEDIGARQMTADNIADWIKRSLTKLCNDHFDRINSIATDMCPTMLRVWEILQKFDWFKHCLFIPCDSHGLQLLIKDLLDLPVFKELHNKIQTIAKAFKNSPLQYARLQEHQHQK